MNINEGLWERDVFHRLRQRQRKKETFFNPNKAGLLESSFLRGQFDPLFIFQEELI